ncbi:MAG: lytic transglycosylase domain-containing protein [Gammaproteobacteria bacterium]|nr:lytic transglycosylase domain-containing protein [Gammaproteobacteria bacterium]MCF6229190.1 lytic transglycosylase domain-containing protein [Gammaproteobacteria bacterium]
MSYYKLPRARQMINMAGVLLLLLIFSNQLHAKTGYPEPELLELLSKAVSDVHSFEDRFDAEVWLHDMSSRLARRIPDHEKRIELLKMIHQEAKLAGLQPELVLAVIEVESNFNRWAISSAGARGLMQIMPFWLDELERPDDNLFDIPTNLRFGCTILKHYLDREKGQLSRALARYNGSLGSFRYPNKVFKALRERWGIR